jgi:hypothetical protein
MGKDTERERDDRSELESRGRDQDWVRCAACGHGLTRTSARTEVDGKHVHTCVNPQGIEFTFGCWTEAPGCRGLGEESTFFTWFTGFAWRAALCAHCGTHVGWSFRAESRAFATLIVGRAV